MGTSFITDIMYFGHSCRVGGSRNTVFFLFVFSFEWGGAEARSQPIPDPGE